MFKKAGSPEEFEKLINSEDNNINNLDLDADGQIDYIRVLDKAETDAHAFVLQVAVSETENQDVAVIELEKSGDAAAVLQIIGDEDIYGETVIIEPRGDDVSLVEQEASLTGRGPNAPELSFNQQLVVVNVWFWPSVRFVYGPMYRPWVSPWRWRSYPVWYKPWRPLSWHVYHPRVYRYHRPFVVVHTHRAIRAHKVYTPQRVSSVTVRTRHSAAINHYRVARKAPVSHSRGGSVTRATKVKAKNRKMNARSARERRIR